MVGREKAKRKRYAELTASVVGGSIAWARAEEGDSKGPPPLCSPNTSNRNKVESREMRKISGGSYLNLSNIEFRKIKCEVFIKIRRQHLKELFRVYAENGSGVQAPSTTRPLHARRL